MPYTGVGRGVVATFFSDYHSLGINSSTLGWPLDWILEQLNTFLSMSDL